MRVSYANLKSENQRIFGNAMDVLEKLGQVVAEKARGNLFKHIGKGQPLHYGKRSKNYQPTSWISHGAYKTGKYSGEEWTARRFGSLVRSIRVVRKYGDPEMNVWVMAGNKVTYYASIVEHYTPFLKPAMRGIRAEAKRIFEGRSIGYRMRE